MSDLAVILDQHRTRLGKPVQGAIIAGEDFAAASTRVALRLWEQTPRSRAIGLETQPVQIHDGPLTAGTALRFSIEPPADAYPSYSSPSGATSLRWEVAAVLTSGRAEHVATAHLTVDAAPSLTA